MLLRVGALPEGALDAATAFHAEVLTQIRDSLAGTADDLVLLFAPASHEHHGWRLAAVQQLAREHAPRRANALESDDEAAIAAALDYCARAPGLTGQLLRLDGNGAGALLSSGI
ncbi:MAG: hypothetical protein KDE32_14240 [Novosphingobium sp.]|nr:hypothetical protein [Novosphingobium sp.]